MIVSGEEEQMPKWSVYALILGSHVYLNECYWQYDQSEGVFMATLKVLIVGVSRAIAFH